MILATKRIAPFLLLVLLAGCAAKPEAGAASFDRPDWMTDAAPAPPGQDAGEHAPAVNAAPVTEPVPAAAAIPAPPFEIPPIPVPARPVHTPDDVRAVYDDLVAAGFGLGIAGEVDRVGEVWATECPCHDAIVQVAKETVAEGTVVISPLPEILEFDVLAVAPGAFVVNVTRQFVGGTAYSTKGGQPRDLAPLPPDEFHAGAAVVDGAWKWVALAQGHL